MDTVHSTIKKLRGVDSRLAKQFRKIAQVQAKTKSVNPEFGLWFEKTFASGSLKEGALWAKCFRLQRVVRIFEADFMTPIGQIEDAEEQLVPIDHSPGFCMLTTSDLLQSMKADVKNRYQKWQADPQNQNKDDDVCQSSVLRFVKSLFFTTDAKKQAVELLVDILFQPREASKAQVTLTTDGPSALTVIEITSAEEVLVEVKLDTVPCIELSTWPGQFGYEQWLNRERKWPSRELVSEVQRLLCIVAKVPSNSHGKKLETSNVWRLSFSKAEMLFASTYTENQRDIYYLFKIMFYANIKTFEIDDKTMPSYFCKTTMLWTMEDQGKGFGEVDFEEAIKILFGKFNQFLEKRFLPNFFFPSVNMLDGYPEDLIAICSYMIKELISKPSSYVPSTLNNECEFLQNVEERLNGLQVEYFVDAINKIMEVDGTNGRDGFELFLQLFTSRNRPEK